MATRSVWRDSAERTIDPRRDPSVSKVEVRAFDPPRAHRVGWVLSFTLRGRRISARPEPVPMDALPAELVGLDEDDVLPLESEDPESRR